MSQGPLCPNLTQKVQKEVSQIANHNLPLVILLGGLSVNLNHLIKKLFLIYIFSHLSANLWLKIQTESNFVDIWAISTLQSTKQHSSDIFKNPK